MENEELSHADGIWLKAHAMHSNFVPMSFHIFLQH